MIEAPQRALVVFSGGQDSATRLAWGLARFEHVETIGFAYGQRHSVELECREPIRVGMRQLSEVWNERLGADHIIYLSVLGRISASTLTADLPLGTIRDGMPATFVPGRNIVFLAFASIVAEQLGLKHVIAGMCETDYSGYPDCRDDTIKSLQATLKLGVASRIVLHTPLMWRNKAATWQLAEELAGHELLKLIQEESHSCNVGERAVRHPWGYGCNTYDACNLRRNGWLKFASSHMARS
jgi:7-cyano-7-deazaguanine synthase